MDLVRAIRRLLLGRSPTKQKLANTDCPILQLPVDSLLLIVDELSPAGQIFLSQTCRGLRLAILQQHHLRGVDGVAGYLKAITHKQRLEFLFIFAHNRLDRWVCQGCEKLHPVVELDTPATPRHASCYLDPSHCMGWRDLLPDGTYGLNYTSLMLGHRHLQLALKYTRLVSKNNRHRTYLKRLLAPYHAPCLTKPDGEDDLTSQYSAYPKVVGGRYLLLSVWGYQSVPQTVTWEGLGGIEVCEHQASIIWWKCSDAKFRRLTKATERLAALQDNPVPPQSSSPTEVPPEAVEDAVEVEVLGSCSLCATDFSVRASPERIEVRAWQDLGCESSWLDPAWGVNFDMAQTENHPVVMKRKPGSTRKLYSRVGDGDEEESSGNMPQAGADSGANGARA